MCRQIVKSLVELTKEFGIHPVSEGIHLRGLTENVIISHVIRRGVLCGDWLGKRHEKMWGDQVEVIEQSV